MTQRRPFTSIRILVADDHPAVLAEVKALIGAATDMIVVGETHDGWTAVGLATELKPDVIVLDIGLSRVKVIERLRAACPASNILLHILPEEKVYLRPLVELGVAGYLLKSSSAHELIGAIRAVTAGGFFFDPAVVGRLDGS
jgi:DNA-binding NarL/FixJ family response regulator